MDYGWFAGLLGFAFAMAATPGPNNMLVAASGAACGLRRTLPLMAGIASGVATIMLAVSVFGSSLVAQPVVGETLKWVGVAYLSWLAWKIARAKPAPAMPDMAASASTACLSFLHGALVQFINPKLWAMVAGAIATYGQAADQLGTVGLAAIFAAVLGTTTFASTVAWTALGASMNRCLISHGTARTFNVVMAALLLMSLVPVMIE